MQTFQSVSSLILFVASWVGFLISSSALTALLKVEKPTQLDTNKISQDARDGRVLARTRACRRMWTQVDLPTLKQMHNQEEDWVEQATNTLLMQISAPWLSQGSPTFLKFSSFKI